MCRQQFDLHEEKISFLLKLVENLTVVAGDHTQSKDEGTEQTIQVKDYFEHPGWFKNNKTKSLKSREELS